MKDKTIFTFKIWDGVLYEEIKQGIYKDGTGQYYKPFGIVKVSANNVKEAEKSALQKAKEVMLRDNIGVTFKEVDISV